MSRKTLYTNNPSVKSPSNGKRRKVLLIVTAVIVAIVILIGVLELTNTTYLFHKRIAVSGTIPATNSADQTTSDKSSNSSTSSSSTSTNTTKTSAPTTPQGELTAPYGTFVSNHGPSLSNPSNAPSGEESTCITTPGASCTITFTKDGVTKTLSTQTVDSKGAVYWSWDVNKAGFTDGNWTITATATANGQTKSTKDSLELRVSP